MLIKLTTFMCSYWGLQTQYNSIKESDWIFSISRTETQLTKTKTIVTLFFYWERCSCIKYKVSWCFLLWMEYNYGIKYKVSWCFLLWMEYNYGIIYALYSFISVFMDNRYILVHETMLFILLQGSTKFFTKPQSF